MQTADRRPQTADRRPQTADRRPLGAKRIAVFSAFVFAFLVGALPARAQLILYEVPNFWDFQWVPNVTGGSTSTLEVRGLGSAEIWSDNPNFFGKVLIRGARLTLIGYGQLHNASSFQIENGGTLFLDNGNTWSPEQANRIGNWTPVTLNASTLHLGGSSSGSLTEQIGQFFIGGASTLQLTHNAGADAFTALAMTDFALEPFATFNLTGNRRFGTNEDLDSVRVLVNSPTPPSVPISEFWVQGTVEGKDWVATTKSSDGSTYFVAFEDYYTGNPTTWTSSHHVLIDGTYQSVNGWQVAAIGSLKLASNATLAVGWPGLTFSGLLSTDPGWAYSVNIIRGSGRLSFQYAHIYNAILSLRGSLTLETNFLVKTGPGTLFFRAGSVSHSVRNLYIHQGSVSLQTGSIKARTIIVGDGAGADILELPANRTNPIEGLSTSEDPGSWRNITLRGTPYGRIPGSGVVDAAILRFGGSTVQNFDEFRVEGRGMIDFVGGTESAPNQLFIENFILGAIGSGDISTTMFFIRNWEEQHDFLLVRRSAANIARIDEAFLSRIYFEHYGAPGATWVYWSDEYWEIKPFPEPTTYGAIFGAISLGLVAWRKKRTVNTIKRTKRRL